VDRPCRRRVDRPCRRRAGHLGADEPAVARSSPRARARARRCAPGATDRDPSAMPPARPRVPARPRARGGGRSRWPMAGVAAAGRGSWVAMARRGRRGPSRRGTRSRARTGDRTAAQTVGRTAGPKQSATRARLVSRCINASRRAARGSDRRRARRALPFWHRRRATGRATARGAPAHPLQGEQLIMMSHAVPPRRRHHAVVAIGDERYAAWIAAATVAALVRAAAAPSWLPRRSVG